MGACRKASRTNGSGDQHRHSWRGREIMAEVWGFAAQTSIPAGKLLAMQ
jgi:hypothetical protein